MSDEKLEASTEIRASTEFLAQAREFLIETLEKTTMPEKDARAVVLAVDEALANTIEHGYGNSGKGVVKLSTQCDSRRFCVTIIDTAERYDSASNIGQSNVDMKTHVEAGKRRGLGLFIMRKVMDEVKYAYRNGTSNELTLVKYIKAEDG